MMVFDCNEQNHSLDRYIQVSQEECEILRESVP